MNIGQSIFEALESLSANKLRSGLTILGIVIGVGAVIAMLGVGQGAQDTITNSISGIGTNLLFVFPGNFTQNVRNGKPLTISDANALLDQFSAPSILTSAPVIQGNTEVAYGKTSLRLSVTGATPEYIAMSSYSLLEGEFITESHNLGQAAVAILGPEAADRLFGRRDGVTGENIRINGQPFRVLGVLAPKGGSAFGSQDRIILVPFSTAQNRVLKRQKDRADYILIQAVDAESVSFASDEASQVIRERHRSPIGEDDFTILSQQDFVQTAQLITGVLTVFLGGIAGISLLVGGIGIMNIMLVSVTERTREIGLRKALGARKRDIMIQFLTESALLSLIGGLIGIALGWLIAFIVGQIAAANGTPLNPGIGLNAILLATAFSTAVGLFFGIYPANRAAGLEPVEALRYE
ncbi:MAG TPA: ABC transporter permease [Anaerolineaceae bacterium]|nr:ABC transporter permease [Anaerolineaceae bacterium]HPN51170.1 ABC transporter permease [Anaerolineaceae bacterium]